jgi:hypothetical protein
MEGMRLWILQLSKRLDMRPTKRSSTSLPYPNCSSKSRARPYIPDHQLVAVSAAESASSMPYALMVHCQFPGVSKTTSPGTLSSIT